MRLNFIPQYRDDTDAAAARFPGDAVNPQALGAPSHQGAIGWVIVALAFTLVALVVATRGRARPALWDALVQADRIDHPVFIAGVILAAVGASMVILPLTYLLGVRRAARPVLEQAVRVELTDECVTVGMPSKELEVAWHGVVAVAETRDLFVLKTVGDLRLALPKRGVAGFEEHPERLDALRELLRRRVAPMAEVAAVREAGRRAA